MADLLRHFTHGTEGTVTGGEAGCEIETIFVDELTGDPVSQETSTFIRQATASGQPDGCTVHLDLSRATFELVVAPCSTSTRLLDRALTGLAWLYRVAARYGARPIFAPQLEGWTGPLVDVSTDPRDQAFAKLDGLEALELLTCASVQFSVDVNPQDAIWIINQLLADRVHELDFGPNHECWLSYIKSSTAGYHEDRYGGPDHFEDLADYVAKLSQHYVRMYRGPQPNDNTHIVDWPVSRLPHDGIDNYLRSVWWHFRLRRYGYRLVLELRPFARRGDDGIERTWRLIAPYFEL